ncbi:Uu.00g066360.m01.CDS01 [Anthostomella pinea]|uniref:Uu.00g066360.m01.CDS01 n=1 Tax=Anthostomella pinea TaxID=933095 RepID=A0AAI8VTY1_9PEZI|nr:Uu.00g066360.m01.CDS01 [Anthostomella pinea]
MSAAVIQRFRMGSSQPPDGNLPFGYNFPPDQDLMYSGPPPPPPPPPPPGAPILSHEDGRTLYNFFDNMATDAYPLSYGEGLHHDDQWIPDYLGAYTFLGPGPPPNSSLMDEMSAAALQDMYNLGQPPMPPPPPQPPIAPQFQQHQPQHGLPAPHTPIEHNAHAGAVVLTALHNDRRNGRYNGHNNGPYNAQPQRTISTSNFSQTTPVPRHQISPGPGNPVRPFRSNDSDTLTDMVFGSQGPNRLPETTELQWGSDAAFARDQGFIPPVHESREVLEQQRTAVMKALHINGSADTTQTLSPFSNGGGSSNGLCDTTNRHVNVDDEPVAPPRKCRKGTAKKEVEEGGADLTSIPPRAATKKRKSKTDLNGSSELFPAAQETAGKRRKSSVTAAKAARENLSEAQKRENHIKSEKKRRAAISEGFEDLNKMVPALKDGGGGSKSQVLVLTGQWLEELIRGNEELRQLL